MGAGCEFGARWCEWACVVWREGARGLRLARRGRGVSTRTYSI